MAHKQHSGRRPATKLPNLQKKLQQQRQGDKRAGGRQAGPTK